MELLEVRHIRKIYNTRLGSRQCVALQDVSFTVEQGEFVAIMGASGSGKTTLLNILASLDRPTEGEVLLEGRSFASIKDRDLSRFRRDKLGFVFQDFNLLDTLTIRDNILLPLVLAGAEPQKMLGLAGPLAESLGIGDLLDKYPHEVSGGEKQRAAVARAVITNPRILLADEPTGALDSKASASLLERFSALHAAGQTILMVTHSANAASYASRILFIQDGMLFNQIYRGDSSRREFFDRIVSTLTVLTDGGADVG